MFKTFNLTLKLWKGLAVVSSLCLFLNIILKNTEHETKNFHESPKLISAAVVSIAYYLFFYLQYIICLSIPHRFFDMVIVMSLVSVLRGIFFQRKYHVSFPYVSN